eukprot:TRINITY_DN4015_c0_g1_i1.p1 TRINITY_DN4015_c0_g1~~TRINITY_DN4015_c0_g1_i1.p1  ORF type:complete len:285 (-),score=51.85 TRINITY_DN4015_c0_g1_i1:189-1043(-)
MQYVTTLQGVQMPRMIYGTAWKKAKTAYYVVRAVNAGFRGIDTACQPKHYQENLVGDALKILNDEFQIPRESLFIQTKFTSIAGQDPRTIPYNPGTTIKKQVRESLQISLKNLQTSYVDSLVLHSPLKSQFDTENVWKEFERLVKDGLVKQLGISNVFSLSELKTIWDGAKIKPAVVQNRFSPDTKYDEEIRKFCMENDVHYQSFWTLTANGHILQSPEVTELAKKYECTREQIFFRFVLDLGITPLTGTTSDLHMRQDLDVLDMKSLEREEIALLMTKMGIKQ